MVWTCREHSPESNENMLTNACCVIGEIPNWIGIQLMESRQRSPGGEGGETAGGPHPIEYGERPALTLWPLLRVPRISAGPQSGMAWKIARSSPAEGGRTRAWCGTTERVSMLRFGGKVVISFGTFQESDALAPWDVPLGIQVWGSWEWGTSP